MSLLSADTPTVLLLKLAAILILVVSCAEGSGTGFASSAPNAYTKWVASLGKKYTKSTFLSKGTDARASASVAIHWTIDLEASAIHLAVAAESTGWLGLGLCEMGGMPGSDMLIFESSGNRLMDAYATAYERPKIDEQQDWKLVDSTVDDGFLIFEATRKLDTGDSMDWPITDDSDPLLPGTKLIAAWGDTTEMHHHGPDNRLQGSVRFFGDPSVDDKAMFEEQMNQEAEGSVLMKLDNFAVPGRWGTWYEHRCFTVSQLAEEQSLPQDKPLHLIGFEWLIDPGDHVHHIAVYSSTTEKISKCDPSGPHSFMHVWNKGQEKHYFLPENVGMLLSDESKTPQTSGLGRVPKSFRLEVHYENQKKIKGDRDSSGVRLHYTSKLRQHTGAIMEFGDPTVKLVGKPIGEGLQRHKFDCPDSCTRRYVKTEGVTVLYEMLHMHMHGLTMQNIHKRNGSEIRRGSVSFFDFDQGAKVVKQKPFELLPGDSFETYCNYDGERGLQFGYEASREMCMAWLFYYPAADVHLSCSFEADEKGCAAEHSSVKAKHISEFGRTFGETSKKKNSIESVGAFHDTTHTEGKEISVVVADKSRVSIIFVCIVLFLMVVYFVRPRHDYDKLNAEDKEGTTMQEGGVTGEDGHTCPVRLQTRNGGIRRRDVHNTTISSV